MTCCICLHPLGGRPLALACGHRFHAPCVRQWLRRSRTCPCCRARCEPSAGYLALSVLGCFACFWAAHALIAPLPPCTRLGLMLGADALMLAALVGSAQ
jgi:hypothetical protein